ncbi:hypothetical protein [Paractinoplanes toevensis]
MEPVRHGSVAMAEVTGSRGDQTPARRPARTVARVPREYSTVIAAGMLLAVALTWPTLRHPWTTIPGDLGDPTLQAWQIAWAGHALRTDPSQLWQTNAFFPAAYSFAYTDTLLGYAPAGLIGTGPEAAVFRYNLLFVLAYALAFVGAYALVRQLGAARLAAAAAGVAWAFAPWRLAHSGHLNVLSVGGIALCLAMLARGHGWSLRAGREPGRHRPGWALAGWAVASWQITLGFAVGLPLVYFLFVAGALFAASAGWSRWRHGRLPYGERLLAVDALGGLLFATASLLMARPYLRVLDLNPQAHRDLSWSRMFSPPLQGFLITPGDSWLWGGSSAPARATLSWPPEMAVFPGATLLLLGVAGLFYSVFRARYRILLGLGVLCTGALTLGSNLGADGNPGYLTLSRLLPGWDALRTPGRLMVWAGLLLAVLTAGMITELAARVDRHPFTAARPGRWAAHVALLIPLALAIGEGVNRTPHPEVPRSPVAMRSLAAPAVFLPSDGLLELNIMFWSTDGFPRIANGLANFVPNSQERIRRSLTTFPDAVSVAFLRQVGIRSVVVLPDRLAGTPWEGTLGRPVDGLGIDRRQIGEAIVYRLDPRQDP